MSFLKHPGMVEKMDSMSLVRYIGSQNAEDGVIWVSWIGKICSLGSQIAALVEKQGIVQVRFRQLGIQSQVRFESVCEPIP